MSDFKVFLMYIFDPKGLIEGFKEGINKAAEPKTLSILLIYLALLSLFLSKEPSYSIIMGLLIVSFIIQLRIAYIGGDHRFWYKQKVKDGMSYKDAHLEVEKMIDEVIKNRGKKDKDSLGI